MSALTFLVAESFLMIAATGTMVFIVNIAADRSAEIVTGVVRGIPVSPRAREGILYGMWLPFNALFVALAVFLALTQLQMADHVTDANVKLVVYFVAFLCAMAGAFDLVLLPIALFAYRAKLRRDKQRQAEAD